MQEIFQMPARWVMAALGLACFGLLAFGFYLQHAVGLEPCPMCIVQRYCLILVAVACLLGASKGQSQQGRWQGIWGVVAFVFSVCGAFVAARQSFLQWYPPEVMTCGRDFYGMVESFPLQRAIPMIFKGSGDCAEIDWTFLGASIANWSFVSFAGFSLILAALAWRHYRRVV